MIVALNKACLLVAIIRVIIMVHYHPRQVTRNNSFEDRLLVAAEIYWCHIFKWVAATKPGLTVDIWCHIDRLVQERRNSSALAMELCLSCTNPLLWWYRSGSTLFQVKLVAYDTKPLPQPILTYQMCLVAFTWKQLYKYCSLKFDKITLLKLLPHLPGANGWI